MKNILTGVLLAGLLFSMAAAQSNDKTTTKSQTFKGWVSDEKCGTKIDAACAKKCQEEGVPLIFISDDRSVVHLASLEPLKGFAGQRVVVTGKLEKGVLTIESIKPLAK